MKNIKLVGASVVLFSVLVTPAMARNEHRLQGHSAQSVFCATREPGNLTVNTATTSHGPNGDSEVLGTARSTTLAFITLATYRESAASTHRAKYCSGHTPETIVSARSLL